MLKLIDYELIVEPWVLLVKPFKAIWDKDNSKSKENAMAIFTYIYHMTDPRSEHFNITDEDERSAFLVDILFSKSWKPDKNVNEAIEIRKKSLNTVATKLLKNSLIALDRASEFIGSIEFDENNLKKVLDSIKSVPETNKIIMSLKEQVEKELNSIDGNNRGTIEKNMFEDGF